MRRSTLLFCFFFFHHADGLRLLRQCRLLLFHSLIRSRSEFCLYFLIAFYYIEHLAFAICWQGRVPKRGTGGRAVASITSICFLFKFCILCQGSWWQGCIKCFCGCKSELMRAEKNGKKSKQRERGKRGREVVGKGGGRNRCGCQL